MRKIVPAALAMALLAGCGTGAKRTPPVLPVEVITVAAQDTSLYSEYIGDIRAANEVAIYPRINGVVLRRAFAEGTMVREGQLLFEIEEQRRVVADGCDLEIELIEKLGVVLIIGA